jgi:hypothetical protein
MTSLLQLPPARSPCLNFGDGRKAPRRRFSTIRTLLAPAAIRFIRDQFTPAKTGFVPVKVGNGDGTVFRRTARADAGRQGDGVHALISIYLLAKHELRVKGAAARELTRPGEMRLRYLMLFRARFQRSDWQAGGIVTWRGAWWSR